MDNSGRKLTQEILKELGFTKQVASDSGGDEIKWWTNEVGISIHESSWWLRELSHSGTILETPVSCYEAGEETPEIEFHFAVYIKNNGEFKSGFSIETDQQVKNLYFSLTDSHIDEENKN